MEKYFMNKTQFAKSLGISLSTLERREKQMGYYLSSGVIGLGEREAFIEKMRDWEYKKLNDSGKSKPDKI